MSQPPLHQQLTTLKQTEGEDFFRRQAPLFLFQNLRPSLGKRSYQQEAFGRFAYYFTNYNATAKEPLQLLFHMATGSGKTVVMAGLILYLYQKGYRHFLFFVNSNTIIEKTKDNFLNTASIKYLFNDVLNIESKEINLVESTNFDKGNEDDIQLVFSTIQGLHYQLNNPAENSLTLEDFEGKPVVLISDEAHHINAETKKQASLTADEKEELVSWEATVRQLLHTHAKNILLEFTATVDLLVPQIAAKYNDKIIFDYSLKQFRQQGYSKEVKVLQSGQPLFERALQAVLLSQYRYKVFQKWGLFIKPVILFKSKTIKESEAFLKQFIAGINTLSILQLEKIKIGESNSVLQRLFQYLEAQNVSLQNFVLELQEAFSEEKLVSVNSRDESEKKQLAINTLEEESNPYRVVFAVDKLNEGWDVLNLFDIVRLYDTADTAKGMLKKTTLSEAQLIGRGARYCPFAITAGQAVAQRKFDDEIEHELRIGEELYYHSPYNPRYIFELNQTLMEMGIKEKEGEGIQKTKKAIPFQKKKALKNVFNGQVYRIVLGPQRTTTRALFDEVILEKEAPKSTTFPLSILPEVLLQKSMDRLPFFYFNNLKKHFPSLRSAAQFRTSNEFLGSVSIALFGSTIDALSATQQLELATSVLIQIEQKLVM